MNNDWKNWVKTNLQKGISSEKIEKILMRENYAPFLIKEVLGKCLSSSDTDVTLIPPPLLSQESKTLIEKINNCQIEEQVRKNGLVRITDFLDTDSANYIETSVMNIPDEEWKMAKKETNLQSNNPSVKHSFKYYNKYCGGKCADIFYGFRHLFPKKEVDIAIAAYSSGDGIDRHTDHGGYINKNNTRFYRDIAFVYYINKNWEKEYGGVFIDEQENKEYLPEFNSLVLFDVPRYHTVTPMNTLRVRYSVFGWFLTAHPKYNLPQERFKIMP